MSICGWSGQAGKHARLVSDMWVVGVQENRSKKLAGKLEDGLEQKKKSRRNLWLLLYHYWHRLLGTALGWFAWDFYYCALPSLFSEDGVTECLIRRDDIPKLAIARFLGVRCDEVNKDSTLYDIDLQKYLQKD